VGVAGFVNSGGFGSLSKAFGTAAGNLIEAEVVTADGPVTLANARMNPDLFWALTGGGSGFGVVTRVTLRTHQLPEVIGAVRATIDAASDDAYRRLVAKAFDFYAKALFNPQWGEQFRLQRGRRLWIQMLFHGLEQRRSRAFVCAGLERWMGKLAHLAHLRQREPEAGGEGRCAIRGRLPDPQPA
jgi:hypothetical protein